MLIKIGCRVQFLYWSSVKSNLKLFSFDTAPEWQTVDHDLMGDYSSYVFRGERVSSL